MKIRKLVMAGFGPYAQRQELDFETSLRGRTMFVITGNTGAGKTTIFDAVNFALYGEASGSEREGKSLRSDFADAQTPTEVELWFSLRGKDYYVKRSPAYDRAKQRGDGFVSQPAAAELKYPDGKVVTRTNQVTEEIEKILGITAEQFKQLVMIPQGEFKRLLNAGSDEKEDIFRKIFGTEIFDRIQRQIREQALALQRGSEQIKMRRMDSLRSFRCRESDGDLKAMIAADEPNIALLLTRFKESAKEEQQDQSAIEERIQKQGVSLEDLQKKTALAEEVNRKLDALEQCRKDLESFMSRSGLMKEKELQLAKAKKALSVKPYEDSFRAREFEVTDLTAALALSQKTLAKLRTDFAAAEQRLAVQKNREKEKTDLLSSLEEKEKLKSRTSEYEKVAAAVKTLESDVSALRAGITAAGELLSSNDEKTAALDRELEGIRTAKDEKSALEIEQARALYQKDRLEKLSADAAQWLGIRKEHDDAAMLFETTEKRFLSAKLLFEQTEDTFRKNQAGILAGDLAEGSPCPVCGSTLHPCKASLKSCDISEEAVTSSRESFEKHRLEKDAALHSLTDLSSSMKAIAANAIAPAAKDIMVVDDSDIEGIKAQCDCLLSRTAASIRASADRIKALDALVSIERDTVQSRDALVKMNDLLRTELQSKNEQLALDSGRLSSARTTLETIAAEFKGSVKTVAGLDAEIMALNGSLASLKKEFETAERSFNEAKTLLDKEEGNFISTEKRKGSAGKELLAAERAFRDAVALSGFADEEEYRKSRLSDEASAALEEDLRSFSAGMAGAQKLYERSSAETKGLTKADLSSLKGMLETERSVKKALDDEYTELLIRLRHNSDIIRSCESFSREIERDEKEYEVIGKLSKIINGDNPRRVSFERYVLAAYFDDIIDAANIRFGRMTNRRFELLRKIDTGDKRKGQGLDLEVFDNYTGKPRDVKTLSGGESFKASLSMALGLADIVQSGTGGIQLDTMFIDEGFGTLDPESLDTAIECLMDLQNDGRLVGIISHVPELKERIDARLEVCSTNRGSSAEFRV